MESVNMELCGKKEAQTVHSECEWRQAEGGMNIKQTPFCQAPAISDVLCLYTEVNTVCQCYIVYDFND